METHTGQLATPVPPPTEFARLGNCVRTYLHESGLVTVLPALRLAAEVMRLRGAWSEAEREASSDLLETMPAFAAEALYQVGEVRRHPGDLAAAQQVFRPPPRPRPACPVPGGRARVRAAAPARTGIITTRYKPPHPTKERPWL